MKNMYLAKKLCALSLILVPAFSYGMEKEKQKMRMYVAENYKEDCPLSAEEYYKKGQRFGTNYCDVLAKLSLLVKDSRAWHDLWEKELSLRFYAEGILYNTFVDDLADGQTLFKCWNAFQRGILDTLQLFKVDECFTKIILPSVDLRTQNTQELERIGMLYKQLQSFYDSWVKKTQDNLVPQTMEEVKELEDSRCVCAPEPKTDR